MSEVSNLKLKMNSMGKDRFDFDRFRDNEVCGRLERNSSWFSVVFLNLHTHTVMWVYTSKGEYVVIDSKQLCLFKGKGQKVE